MHASPCCPSGSAGGVGCGGAGRCEPGRRRGRWPGNKSYRIYCDFSVWLDAFSSRRAPCELKTNNGNGSRPKSRVPAPRRPAPRPTPRPTPRVGGVECGGNLIVRPSLHQSISTLTRPPSAAPPELTFCWFRSESRGPEARGGRGGADTREALMKSPNLLPFRDQ